MPCAALDKSNGNVKIAELFFVSAVFPCGSGGWKKFTLGTVGHELLSTAVTLRAGGGGRELIEDELKMLRARSRQEPVGTLACLRL